MLRKKTHRPHNSDVIFLLAIDEAFMRQKVFYLVQPLHIKWAGFISIVGVGMKVMNQVLRHLLTWSYFENSHIKNEEK